LGPKEGNEELMANSRVNSFSFFPLGSSPLLLFFLYYGGDDPLFIMEDHLSPSLRGCLPSSFYISLFFDFLFIFSLMFVEDQLFKRRSYFHFLFFISSFLEIHLIPSS